MAAASSFLIAGAVIAAAGAIQQGQAQKQQSKANARLLDLQAKRTRELARIKEQRQRRDSSRLMGMQRAGFAAGGVNASTGTAALVQQQTARDAEFEALLIRAQGETEASLLEMEAAATRKKGNNQFIGGLFSGGGSLLTGAAGAF